MANRSSSWPVWTAVLVSVAAFISYPLVFVRFTNTRNNPWATLLLFAVAVLLAVLGLRRTFEAPSTRGRKIAGIAGAVLTFVTLALFALTFWVVGRQIPAATGAPRVGQKAPDFQLPDTTGRPVTLAELRATPVNGQPPRGVLLVFYRGYW